VEASLHNDTRKKKRKREEDTTNFADWLRTHNLRWYALALPVILPLIVFSLSINILEA